MSAKADLFSVNVKIEDAVVHGALLSLDIRELEIGTFVHPVINIKVPLKDLNNIFLESMRINKIRSGGKIKSLVKKKCQLIIRGSIEI